jgi:hypothetical protein
VVNVNYILVSLLCITKLCYGMSPVLQLEYESDLGSSPLTSSSIVGEEETSSSPVLSKQAFRPFVRRTHGGLVKRSLDDYTKKGFSHEDILWMAVNEVQLKLLNCVLFHYPNFNLNICDENLMTPLHHAILREKCYLAQFLILKGARWDMLDNLSYY